MSAKPELTEAELTNLRTLCMTAPWRGDPTHRAMLDALAAKLFHMREALAGDEIVKTEPILDERGGVTGFRLADKEPTR